MGDSCRILLEPWDQSMGSSGFTAGGSLELPDRLLTTGNRRLHNASLLGAGMSPRIRGDLFGYVAGLLSTIGCLEGHSVKPVEVAAMREVCRVRGWEIPVEFSLNPPNSPAVLIHWRALIELLALGQ
jgi:hypothetical protein